MCKQVALYIDRNYQRQAHIGRRLEPLGFEVHKTSNAQVAREMAKKHYYHLVLAHFNTMGRKIFGFCSFVRSGSCHTILIALMACVRIDVEERLFDCGVNDVVAGRQTAARVLTKRIRAHLRNNKSCWPQTTIIRLKDTLVDFDRRQVWCNGTIHQLRGILPDLLKYFLNNSDRVISREELQNSPIWFDSICSSAEEGGKTFDVNIGKLRRIIEPDPIHPQIIISVRGEGWVMAEGIV